MLVGETMPSLSLLETIQTLSNIASISLGNNPFYSMGWIKLTSSAPPLPDPQTTEAVPRVKLKALGKVKLRQS